MISQTECSKCQASVPASSRFCPACGQLVNPNAEDPIAKAKESAEFKSMMSAALAGMALFFSFGFLLPGLIAEPGFLWVSLILFLVAVALLAYRSIVLRGTKRDIERLKAELHVKCKYCGGVNDKEAHKCAFCGAPL